MKSFRHDVTLAKAPHPDNGLEPLPYRSPQLFEYLGNFVQQLPHFLLELGYELLALCSWLSFDILECTEFCLEVVCRLYRRIFRKELLQKHPLGVTPFLPFRAQSSSDTRFQRVTTLSARLNSSKVFITCRIR